VPDRILPRWLLSRWVTACLLAALLLAIGGYVYDTARRREAAFTWLEQRHHYAGMEPLPRWYPRWAKPPRWLLSVQSIQLSSRDRVDLGPIQPLHEIRRIQVYGAPVDAEGLQAIGRFEGLESVSFAGSRIGNEALTQLQKCRRLRTLELDGTDITDGTLRQLAGLSIESLGLSRTRITDEGLRHLAGLPIRQLILNDTTIGDDGLAHLAGLPLEGLSLVRSEVTEAGLPHLVGLPLSRLDLSETLVGDAGLEMLRPLRLRVLDLQDTQVTDAGLSHLSDHPLESLDLSGTRITDAGLTQLIALPLEQLDLGGTNVTAEGLTTLVGLPKLRSVRVSYPEISLQEKTLLERKGLPVSIGNSHVLRERRGSFSAGAGR
jgi:hypothetical protein